MASSNPAIMLTLRAAVPDDLFMKCVSTLLDTGFDANYRDQWVFSLLHYIAVDSIFHGVPPTVARWLINKGANPNSDPSPTIDRCGLWLKDKDWWITSVKVVVWEDDDTVLFIRSYGDSSLSERLPSHGQTENSSAERIGLLDGALTVSAINSAFAMDSGAEDWEPKLLFDGCCRGHCVLPCGSDDPRGLLSMIRQMSMIEKVCHMLTSYLYYQAGLASTAPQSRCRGIRAFSRRESP
jgi:hypothetical protein